MTRVGVLAIQGDVEAHAKALAKLGAEAVPVLREADLGGVDALILPGGESTTISKGMDRQKLWDPIRRFAASGRPVFGTCVGRDPARAKRWSARRSRRSGCSTRWR